VRGLLEGSERSVERDAARAPLGRVRQLARVHLLPVGRPVAPVLRECRHVLLRVSVLGHDVHVPFEHAGDAVSGLRRNGSTSAESVVRRLEIQRIES